MQTRSLESKGLELDLRHNTAMRYRSTLELQVVESCLTKKPDLLALPVYNGKVPLNRNRLSQV
jgi:hypothetical protein